MPDMLKKFGKYFLLDLVASGGMAEIYRARLASLHDAGRLLAIKRIQQSYSMNSEFTQMFQVETKVTSNFTHPNITQVYDYGNEQGQLFIAMEYVDGKNLRQFINRLGEQKAVFPIEVSCFIIEQSALALQYAHDFKDRFSGKSLNIIHRDISPQNLLVSFDGAVKVIDFGIAKTESQSESTRAGIIKGKPSYLSPEQIAAEVLDGRCDIFALGVVFWELLTGKKLFAGDNDLAVFRMVENCQNHVKAPSLLNPKVPKELDAILLKSLEKDRKKRYQTASEMQRAIRKFLSQYSPDFNPADLSYYAKDLFKNEIVLDRKRLTQMNAKAEELIRSGVADVSQVSAASQNPAIKNSYENEEATSVSFKKPSLPAEDMLPPVKRKDVQFKDPKELPEMSMPVENNEEKKDPSPPKTEKPAAKTEPAKQEQKDKVQIQKFSTPIQLESKDVVSGSFHQGVYTDAFTKSGSLGSVHTHTGTHLKARRKVQKNNNNLLFKVASILGFIILGAYLLGKDNLNKKVAKNTSRHISAVSEGDPLTDPAAQANKDASLLNLKLKISPAGGNPQVTINGQVHDVKSGTLQVPLDKQLEIVINREGCIPFKRGYYFESSRLSKVAELPLEIELTPSRYGFLSINTTPSTEAIIYIDGGEERILTPFAGKRLPAGEYRVLLENRLLQISKEIKVKIEERKIEKRNERLTFGNSKN